MYNFPPVGQQQPDIGSMTLEMAKAYVEKHTTPTGTPSTPYTHGPGGLFGLMGLEQDVLHTRVSGRGLAWRLPTIASMDDYPLYSYITGFTDTTGTVADGVCDDPEVAGQMKNCVATAPFGRYSYMTRELEINRVGLRINRGEFLDLRLLNDPIVPELGESIFPNISGNSQLNAGAEVLARYLELGVAFVNHLGRQLYIANPANNSAGGGYQEMIGLDLLLGTNWVDAFTGGDCPSLYPDIKDFNYGRVDDMALNPTIVRVLTTIFRQVKYNSEHMNLDPTTWVIAMRQSLFWEITDVWACAYWSYRCATHDNTNTVENLNIDARGQTEFRDDMRNGRYLLIDGQRIPVVIDPFIPEDSSNNNGNVSEGCFASDIYIIPLSSMGGRPTTFFHYFDYRGGPMEAVVDGRLSSYFWTDGGRFLWHAKPPLNWCVQWVAKTEPRLIMLTPFLAGRIQNVMYCPLQHEREVHPDDPYWVDGGETSRTAPSFYMPDGLRR